MQQSLGVIRTAINAKRWHQARYALSRARALVGALPADLATEEREQLSLLRKKFEARNTTAAKKAKELKLAPATHSGNKKQAVRATAKKSAARTSAAKATLKSPSTPPPAPVRELGERFINRASLGYGPEAEAHDS
ncbi:hypothetical protein ABT224_16025 [Streptomyces sp. NPDC001584]|uniref:hypothetical protein n=1 Tax=Streptomyces sp. NPDC001584 TaxID=3154521 RepID=UPI00332B8108